jgi:hypothetical protein
VRDFFFSSEELINSEKTPIDIDRRNHMFLESFPFYAFKKQNRQQDSTSSSSLAPHSLLPFLLLCFFLPLSFMAEPRPTKSSKETQGDSSSSSRASSRSRSRSSSRPPGTKNRRQVDLEDLESELLSALGDSQFSSADFSDEEATTSLPLRSGGVRAPGTGLRGSSINRRQPGTSSSSQKDGKVRSITTPNGQSRSLSAAPPRYLFPPSLPSLSRFVTHFLVPSFFANSEIEKEKKRNHVLSHRDRGHKEKE